MKVSIKRTIQEYDIHIGKGLLDRVDDFFDLNRNVLIVTDDNIPNMYIEKVKEKSDAPIIVKLKNGEENKNFDNFRIILDTLINNKFTRTDCIVSIGGGVIGDMVGFASSVYMRGIDFYNVPTTFLSQVDSSIGGKTVIDYMNIKNAIGSFYQPKSVLIDVDTLNTLPPRHLKNGLVETIKMAATFDRELFEYLENIDDIKVDLENIIIKSLMIKKKVVEEDVDEKNVRRVLNFGHTIGHAIEETCGGRYLHGECVGVGMLYFSSDIVKERLKKILKKYNLPVDCSFDKEKAKDLISHDKKTTGKNIYTIFCNEIGTYEIKQLPIESIKGMI